MHVYIYICVYVCVYVYTHIHSNLFREREMKLYSYLLLLFIFLFCYSLYFILWPKTFLHWHFLLHILSSLQRPIETGPFLLFSQVPCRFMVDDAKTHAKSRINICILHGENKAWEKTCPRMLTTQWQSLLSLHTRTDIPVILKAFL